MVVDNKLEIFENFQVERKEQNNNKYDINEGEFEGISIGTDAFVFTNSNSIVNKSNLTKVEYYEHKVSIDPNLINRFKLFIYKYILDTRIEKKFKKYQLIEDFYKSIKLSINSLNIDESKINFYTNAIDQAIKNGQISFRDHLVSRKDNIITELALIEKGVTQYVSEEDIVKFYNKIKLPKTKIIKLTWIKNYVRNIPEDVLEKKYKMDELNIFDNYVILHTDLYDNSTDLTKQEKEKLKDPILFGVVKNSRKLFYVGDWIDEYCDLTLDKLLEVLEKEEVDNLKINLYE